MTEQHTATMRFVRGVSAPAPLADPLTEEEAVLVSDTQAAIQRLRDAVVATVGLHPLWTTCVLRSDLATLIDALDALGRAVDDALSEFEDALIVAQHYAVWNDYTDAWATYHALAAQRGQPVATGGEADDGR